MPHTQLLLLMTIYVAAGLRTCSASDSRSEECCDCQQGSSSARSTPDTACLSAEQMKGRIDHFEPLKAPPFGKGLKLDGVVKVQVRFGADGVVSYARILSGHPMIIYSALEAIRKSIFKPVYTDGTWHGGCGPLRIRYTLRGTELVTSLQ